MPGWLKRAPGFHGHENLVLSKDTALLSLRYVVLDTELTSLDYRTNRLLSIGAIAMRGPSIQLGEQFYRVVNPQVLIPAETVVIHKLRSQDLAGAEPLERTLNDFCQFVQGSVLVGHFVDIELKILKKEMRRTGNQIDNPAVDTARIHRWILRHGPHFEDLSIEWDKVDLATLAKVYCLDVHDAHHALADAYLTGRIWQRMLHTLQSRGIDNLGKLLKIGGV